MPPPVEKTGPKKCVWISPTAAAGVAAGFIAVFLYVWLRLMPAAEQYCAGPLFFYGHSFFVPFAARPGGLAEYAAAYLAQLSYFNWPGGLVFACEGALLAIAAQGLLHRFSGLRVPALAWVPVCLLLILRERGYAASFTVGLGLLMSYGAALLYLRLAPKSPVGMSANARRPEHTGISVDQPSDQSEPEAAAKRFWHAAWTRLIAGALLAGLAFYVGGIWPCALFGVIAALFEILQRKNWAGGLAVLFTASAGPVWMIADSQVPRSQFTAGFGTGLPLMLALSLYIFAPVAAMALALLQKKPTPQKPPPVRQPHPKKTVHRPSFGSRMLPISQWLCWF